MFGPSGGSLTQYLLPIGIALIIIVARNSRPRRLRIERLWLLPAIYLVLTVSALAAAPPPITPISIGLLVLGALIGAGLGWQRARFTEIHIHPETHDLSSRSSPIGMIFIFAILLLRVGARDFLATHPNLLDVPVIAVGDALLVMVVATLAAQRLEIWRRASQMLAEAQGAVGPPPPSSLVS
ncbi:MAG TPA: hypothetical protein VKQ70_17095 [Caulobacteraceae bacterium]|jgi:hypothetical protein|nr:hypothetical protein [Caulobacteraceae bacterium]